MHLFHAKAIPWTKRSPTALHIFQIDAKPIFHQQWPLSPNRIEHGPSEQCAFTDNTVGGPFLIWHSMPMRMACNKDFGCLSPSCADLHLDEISVADTLLCCAEEECGSVITDMLTAPRSQLLSMLKPTQGFVLPPPNRHQQHTRDKLGAGTSQGRNVQAGSTTGSMSLSELSVSDPGMKEPEAWWAQVQMVLLTASMMCLERNTFLMLLFSRVRHDAICNNVIFTDLLTAPLSFLLLLKIWVQTPDMYVVSLCPMCSWGEAADHVACITSALCCQ